MQMPKLCHFQIETDSALLKNELAETLLTHIASAHTAAEAASV